MKKVFSVFLALAALTLCADDVKFPVRWERRSQAKEYQVINGGFARQNGRIFLGVTVKALPEMIGKSGTVSIYVNCDGDRNSGRFPGSQGVDLQINLDPAQNSARFIHWLDNSKRSTVSGAYQLKISGEVLMLELDEKLFQKIPLNDKAVFRFNLSVSGKRSDSVAFSAADGVKAGKMILIEAEKKNASIPAAKGEIFAPVVWQRKNAAQFQVEKAGVYQDGEKLIFAFKIKGLEEMLAGKSSAGLYWNCDGDKASGRFPGSQGADVQFNIDLKGKKLNIVRWMDAKDRRYMTVYEDDYLVENSGDVLYIGLRKPALSQLNIKDDSDFVFQLAHERKRTDKIYCPIAPGAGKTGVITPGLHFTRFGALKSTRIKKSFAHPVVRKNARAAVWDCGAERFAADEQTPPFSAGIPALKASGARGETTSVFFAVEAGTPFSALTVTPENLSGKAAFLPAENQRIQYADYISDDRGTCFTDILFDRFPGKAVKRQFAVWHITIPRNAQAGTYRGCLQLTIDGKADSAIPVELTVYDFELPQFPAMRSAFSIKNGHISPRFPNREIKRHIYDTMVTRGASFRFGPRLPGVEPDFKLDENGKLHIFWENFDRRVKYLTDTLGVNTIQLPPGQLGSHEKFSRWNSILKKNYKNTDDPEFQSVFKQYVKAYAEHIKELGIADKMLFVIWDEPYSLTEPVKGAKLVREAAPEIPVGLFIDRYDPEAKEIDIWLTTLQNVAKTLKNAKGKRVWLYNSNGVNNFRIPAADLRSYFFLADRHNIEGFLSSEINVIAKTGIENGVFFNHYPQHCLFYVSDDGKEVYDSWRLVLLRQGFNDFDYLTIYRQRLKAKNLPVPRWLTEAEPDFDENGMPDFKITTTAELDALREKIAREIEKL